MLLLNGIFTLVVILIMLLQFRNEIGWDIFQVIVLFGWIGFELFTLANFSPLELIGLLIGIAFLLVGMFLGREKIRE